MDLLGSWDNFSKRYPMEQDTRKGKGHWRGCHTFKNIICDGDLQHMVEARDGGLKMGGKYWYYYHLDCDVEYHDPFEPSTSNSPVLPGQPVNILEVPFELGSERTRGRSGSANVTFSAVPAERTLNPADKYNPLRMAPTHDLPRLATSPASLAQSRSASPSPASTLSSTSSKSEGISPASSTSSSFGRFLPFSRKSPASESTSAATVPATKSNYIRDAISHLPLSGSNAGSSEIQRGRRALFGKDRAERERPLDISAPSLISRSDSGRHCIPLSEVTATAFPMSMSPTGSRPASPLRKVIAECSREPSPLGRSPITELSPVVIAPGTREESPLRHVVPKERNDQSSEIAAPADAGEVDTGEVVDDEEDEFNFQSPSDRLSGEEHLTKGLSPPPSRSSPTTAFPPFEPTEPAPAESVVVEDPAKVSLPLAPAHPPEPQPKEGSPQINKSHFSMCSTTTASLSPHLDYGFSYPTSPAMSSMTTSSMGAHSPYRLSSESGAFMGSGVVDTERTNHSDEATSAVDAWDDETSCDELEKCLRGLKMSNGMSKRNAAYFGRSALQGYSLPEEEHASELTIPKSGNGTDAQQDEEFFESLDKHATRTFTALEDFLCDMGYLGGAITQK